MRSILFVQSINHIPEAFIFQAIMKDLDKQKKNEKKLKLKDR